MDRSGPSTPRLLLVEDEPASRLFLQAAAAALPAQVDTAARLSEAYALAQTRDYALWMVDANLPDGDGGALLRRLREHGLDTPAIAHTAACDEAERQRLLAEGFVDVAIKPLSAAAWQDAIRAALDGRAADDGRGLPQPASASAPVWDDLAATRALGGNPTHVTALRDLFLAELPVVREQVVAAARIHDHDRLRGALHKLRASAGFVGAARVDRAVQALQAMPDDASALQGFLEATDQTFATPQSAHTA
ncbi:response regulator [Luteimonas yindakuii]|uniref:response regulator n=1 Tax=Luteimonas yindakuii TaxID=2565782 RepID=UPI0010A4FE98|nr:response regulator [Luteimonas yindakuii]QCO68062.1 response regulator [Luteimonas yindakuii]